jgi:hypothetical protein
MAESVTGLEQGHVLHMLHWPCSLKNGHPMRDGLAVGLLDGWEIRRWSFDFFFARHVRLLKALIFNP